MRAALLVWSGLGTRRCGELAHPPSVSRLRLARAGGISLVSFLGPLGDKAGLELTADVGIGSGERDYRAPDLAVHRPADVEPQWHHTAALVVEIVSPGDKTYEKLPFYAAHHVDEVVTVDPRGQMVHWLGLAGGEYQPLERSQLIELGPAELAQRIDWPDG